MQFCIADMTAHYRQAFDDHQAKVLAEATVQIEAFAMERIPRILAERSGFLTKSSVPETIYADDRGNDIDIIAAARSPAGLPPYSARGRPISPTTTSG